MQGTLYKDCRFRMAVGGSRVSPLRMTPCISDLGSLDQKPYILMWWRFSYGMDVNGGAGGAAEGLTAVPFWV